MSSPAVRREPSAGAWWPLPPRVDGRAAALLWAAVFCGCMIYVYESWLYPNYWYLGFPLSTGSRMVVWFSIAVVLLTAGTLPTQLVRLSDFVVWMLFYFVYAPSMLFVPLQGLLKDDGFSFVCALTVSFLAMAVISGHRFRLPVVRISRRTFVGVLMLLYVACNVYVASVFAGNLQLAGFAEIYAQRAAASDAATGSLVGYAAGLLSGAINPFLIALGLTERRKTWLWLGILGQVFIYSTAAMKAVLASVVLAPIMYYFLVRRRSISAARLGVLIMGSCIAPMILLGWVDESSSAILWQLLGLIFMRTYGMTGALTGVYADFFTNHPYTYFSHINLVSAFLPYPYHESVGQEVGMYMVGKPLDANANFWATDGLASAGNAGVVLMGVVAGLFLILANSAVSSRSRRLAFIAFIPFIVAVSNTSLFTVAFSGGGAALLGLIYLWQLSSPAGPGSSGGRNE